MICCHLLQSLGDGKRQQSPADIRQPRTTTPSHLRAIAADGSRSQVISILICVLIVQFRHTGRSDCDGAGGVASQDLRGVRHRSDCCGSERLLRIGAVDMPLASQDPDFSRLFLSPSAGTNVHKECTESGGLPSIWSRWHLWRNTVLQAGLAYDCLRTDSKIKPQQFKQ